MDEPRIGISLGEDTERLLQDVLGEVDDDDLYIERELEESEGLAGEPITFGVIIGGSAVVLSAVLRLIERRLEHKRQWKAMKMVAEGFQSHPELGKLLAQIAKKNADVSITYGIAKEAWASKRQ
ncbi:hypothetical protein J4G43_026920 [Bradyrhizobium barranii subsp. barranii]|uniref:Uncharacterized protein n=1 Tax=Bradyrhizobium barranii subsp. barranii TaxID=2823807 RepID=A0A939S2R6_9BRAD|nr:hypothetical protein [Bradyrhizobium barranii]UEM08426.1 hypothetical protein J4G43_026920 [Bradyrhizobium barranii subsp. barranii]